MKSKSCITFIIAAALALAMSEAVAATHPAMGAWQLNLAKSTDESTSPPPQSQTFVFAESAQGISLTTTIVGADGKRTQTKGKPIK